MSDNNDFTHEFVVYNSDNNNGTQGTGKFLLYDDNINALKVESVDNIKIGGGEEGQVLVTDGAGNLTWATSTGGGGSQVNADWNSSSGASRILNKPDLTAYLPKSGGTLTGKLNAAQGAGTTGGYSFGGTEGANDTGMFSNADGILDFYADNEKIITVTTSGVTYTEAITLPSNPTSNLQAATKQYVDSSVSALNNFSGSYNDLSNKPTIASNVYIGTTQVTFDRASGSLTLTGVSIDGNAATVSNGVYTNGSYSNPAWITSLAYSKLTDAPSLADVATSGSYTDLADKPTLATVATSGSYSDLTNRPSIFSGSYADLTNKPTLFDGAYLSLTGLPNLAAVATSGDYNDLANKPSIPAAQVNADWNETISESPAYILNKPTIPDLTGYATEAWVNSQGFGSGSGGTSYNQSLNTTDDVTFNKATITGASGIENADGQRITNGYYNGIMYVGSNVTQMPVSILIGGAGPRNEWAFTPDGKLTLPEVGTGLGWTNTDTEPADASNWLASSTISFDKNLGIVLNNEVGNTNYSWVLGKDGKLKLPAGGDIVDSTGASVLGGATALSGLTDVTLEGPIEGSVLTWNDSQQKWENRSIPVATQIANTEPSSPSITDPSTYSVSVGTNGVITMTTARGGIEFGALPEEGAPQHLHIMRPTGQEGSTDLYFGDDYNYVKLPALYGDGTQGVEIGSSFQQGTVNVWRFNPNGTLTFPNAGGGTDLGSQSQDGSFTVSTPGNIILNNTGGAWTFGASGTLTLPNNVVQNTSNTTFVGNGAPTVIYTATGGDRNTIKLLVQAEGRDGENVDWDTHSCEILAVKGLRNNNVAASVYGLVYTSTNPLATFDARYNNTTGNIEITAVAAQANGVYVRVHAIEITTAD